MSKIKPYDEEEGASEGETRVFRNVRDLEPAETEEKSEEAPIHEFEEEEETIYLWDNQLEKIAHGRNYHYKEKKEGAEISSSSQ